MTHKLTLYRKTHDLTLEAFGARIGATKGMVSKWESGRATPRRHFLALIESATGGEVTAIDFFSGVARPQPQEIAEAAE